MHKLPTAVITFIYPAAEPFLAELVQYLNQQTTQQFTVLAFNDGVQEAKQWFQNLSMPYQIINVESRTPMQIRFEALHLLKSLPFRKLIFQDSDDGLSPNRVEIVSSLLDEYAFVVNDLDVMNERGQITYEKLWQVRFENANHFNNEALISCNFAGFTNTSILCELLDSIPPIPKNEIVAVDWFLFYSMLKQSGETGFRTSACATFYRQHGENTIGQMTADKRAMAIEVRKQHFHALQAAGLIAENEEHLLETTSNLPQESPYWWEIEQL